MHANYFSVLDALCKLIGFGDKSSCSLEVLSLVFSVIEGI